MTRVLRGVTAGALCLAIACGGGEPTQPDPPVPPAPAPPPPPPPPPAPPQVLFDAPIVGVPGQDVWYGAYRDQGGRDYTCGIKFYRDHQGVDILLRNFQVQDSGVTVIAAAPGTVTTAIDGLFDRSTVNGSGGFGNHVVVNHGSVTSTYGHMKSGSVAVTSGQEVQSGTQLGRVGSSGNSNWPHLHFEVREGGSAVDPFTGSCNFSPSMWRTQLPYQDTFQVTDAGLTDLTSVSFATLLERPTDVGSLRDDLASAFFWLNFANLRADNYEFRLRDPSGQLLLSLGGGRITTFSVLFLGWRFPVSGVLTDHGIHTLEFWQAPIGSIGLRLDRSLTFTLVPAPVPGPHAKISTIPSQGMVEIWEAGRDGLATVSSAPASGVATRAGSQSGRRTPRAPPR